MAEQADGSIIVDTEIDAQGFRSGSKELLSAAQSLTQEIKNLGESLREIFSQPLTPKVNTSGAEDKVAALEAKVQELEDSLKKAEQISVSTSVATSVATPQVDIGGATKKALNLQRQIDAVNTSVERLEPAFQKAISGNENAMSAFDAKASALEDTISELEAKMRSLGEKQISTDSYKNITSEVEKAEQALFKLYDKQDKMEATGVNKNSRAWQSLQYDIEVAKESLTRFERVKANMESSGTAFQMGVDTSQYAQLESTLASAKAKLEDMRSTEEKISAAQPFNDLMSDIESVDADADKLTNNFTRLKETNVSQNSSQWGNLSFSIKTAQNQLSQYLSTLKELHSTGAIDDSQFQQASTAISAARERMRDLAKETDKARGKLGLFGHIGKGLKSAFSHIGSAVNKMKSLRKESNGATGAIGKLGKKLTGLGSMIKRMLTRKLIMAMFEGVKEGVNNLAQYSSQTNANLSTLKSGLTQLKNSLATAFAPILTIITPILATMINYLSAAITYVGKFVAALTGAKTFAKATAVQEDYAASLGNTGSAAEEAQKQLAGFDKITKLTDNECDSGGGGTSPSEMFEEVPIESSITGFVDRLKDAFQKDDYTKIGKIIGEKINGVVEKINDFIKRDNVSSTITKVVSGIAEGFNSLIHTVDFNLIGDTLAQGLNTAIDTLYLIITEFDWPGLAAQLANGLNGLVKGFDWGKLGKTLSTGVRTAVATIRSAVTTFDWASLGKGVADGINSIDWVGILSDIAGGVSDIVEAALDLVIGIAKNLDWGKLGKDLWNGLVGVMTSVDWGGIISKAFELLGSALAGAGNLIVAFISELIMYFSDAFTDYFTPFIEEAGGNVILGLYNGIVEGVKGIIGWIDENIVQPFINGFKELFGINSPSTVMAELGNFLIQGLLNGISAAWEGIKSFFSTAWENIKTLASDAWESVKTNTKQAWNTVTDKVSNAVESVKTSVKDGFELAKNTVKEKVNSIKNKVMSGFREAKNNVKEKAEGISSKVKEHFGVAWDEVRDKIGWIADKVGTGFKNAAESISNKVSEMKETIANGFSEMWDTVSTKMTDIGNSVSNKFSDVVSSAKEWGSDLCDNLSSGLEKGAEWVVSGASSIADGISSFLHFSEPDEGPLSNFHTFMPDMIELMTDGIKKNQGKAIGAISDMASAIAQEIQSGDYTFSGVEMSKGMGNSLGNFAEQITNSFTCLIDKLQAIAQGVTFAVPITTNSVVPYNVSAAAHGTNNKREAEIVSPLSTIRQAVSEALAQAKGESDTVTIILQLDGKQIYKTVVDQNNRQKRKTGTNPLAT